MKRVIISFVFSFVAVALGEFDSEFSFEPMDNGTGRCAVKAVIYRDKKPIYESELASPEVPLLLQDLKRTVRERCDACAKQLEQSQKELRKKKIFFFDSRCIFMGCFLGKGKIPVELDYADFSNVLDVKNEMLVCRDGA